jgi:hypothetical protein
MIEIRQSIRVIDGQHDMFQQGHQRHVAVLWELRLLQHPHQKFHQLPLPMSVEGTTLCQNTAGYLALWQGRRLQSLNQPMMVV